ncbi:MAG TPA: hypothetical protein VGJ07_08475 [Rugosimonospora sp.]|jgi:hypothetical protein
MEKDQYSFDEEREVQLEDGEPMLPEQTRDDTDRGWGEQHAGGNDDWLIEERPPHWD